MVLGHGGPWTLGEVGIYLFFIALIGAVIVIPRLSRGYRWEEKAQIHLLGLTWRVFMMEPRTLLFCLGACLGFALGIAAWFYCIPGLSGDAQFFIGFFFLCLYMYSIGSLTAVAVTACMVKRFRGEASSLSVGWRAIIDNLDALLPWIILNSAITAPIGTVARRLGAPLMWFCSIPLALWQRATLFVIPIILVEKRGLVEAIRRSNDLVDSSMEEKGPLLAMSNACLVLAGIVVTAVFFSTIVLVLEMDDIMRFFGKDWAWVRYFTFGLKDEFSTNFLLILSFLSAPGLCAIAVVYNLMLVFKTAIYLHMTGDKGVKLRVEEYFPQEALIESYPILSN